MVPFHIQYFGLLSMCISAVIREEYASPSSLWGLDVFSMYATVSESIPSFYNLV